MLLLLTPYYLLLTTYYLLLTTYYLLLNHLQFRWHLRGLEWGYGMLLTALCFFEGGGLMRDSEDASFSGR